METNKTHQLNPSVMTKGAQTLSLDFLTMYLRALYLWCTLKGKTMELQEILKNTGKETIEEVEKENPNRFFNATDKEGNNTEEWFDAEQDCVIKPTDILHNMLFALKMRMTDLQDLAAFLDYHLKNEYENDLKGFKRFLELTIRKYENKFFDRKYTVTVLEWIDEKQKAEEITNTKSKFQRKPGDGFTDLTQELTVLFIHYLRQARFILKEDYSNNTTTGEAFSALTGYSATTLRQKLGHEQLNDAGTRKNLDELYNYLTRMIKRVKDDIMSKNPLIANLN